MKNNNHLELDWHHKPTFSGKYLNFLSAHSISQKKGIVMGMTDRAVILSEQKFHQKNIKLVIDTLLRNNYPIEFIFEIIFKRLKFLFAKRHVEEKKNSENLIRTPWFVIPYTLTTSDKFSSICKNENLKLLYFNNNKFNRFTKVQKGILPKYCNKNMIYKIECKDCDASYVGQTSRKLSSRIAEHRNYINWNTTNKSIITDYRIEFSHEFDWENVQILVHEKFLNIKRLISEKSHILMQKNGLNLRSDAEGLHCASITMLTKLTN
ncbi:hypothetical protein ALC57_03945 [Trachymyrmex cornetzi]|uniref:Helix-turn-helix domain-containing protein n=1 Tax=Trachymyrmex cornetzi TaxID=471704 RepID=A0A151JLI9_9HYME|nr:hypothetical protein ALC57_03945 [Trachymyrmex cornetzi]